MDPREKQQFNDMINKVNEMYAFFQMKKNQQLSFPLDPASLGVLNEAFKTNYFDSIKVRELYLKSGDSVNPVTEGQIRYHENAGTQVLKIYLDGAVKTFTTS